MSEDITKKRISTPVLFLIGAAVQLALTAGAVATTYQIMKFDDREAMRVATEAKGAAADNAAEFKAFREKYNQGVILKEIEHLQKDFDGIAATQNDIAVMLRELLSRPAPAARPASPGQ
jgi:hypothetical protein